MAEPPEPENNLSDTEEMVQTDYDSDSTNMSISAIDEGEDNVAAMDDSSISGERHVLNDEENAPRSPVIGERRSQDGILLSQRLAEPIQNPAISLNDSEEEVGSLPELGPALSEHDLRESRGIDSSSEEFIPAERINRRNIFRIDSSSEEFMPAEGINREFRASRLDSSSDESSPAEQINRGIGTAFREPVLLTSPIPGPSRELHISEAVANLNEQLGVISEARHSIAEVTPEKKQKVISKEPSSPDSDDEGQTCSICLEPWSNSGAHRLVSLKCGHIFGNSCIERWLKGQGGKCPQCNAKATKRDIRVIYAKALKAIDTTDRDRIAKELEEEKSARRKLELENAHTKLQCDMKSALVMKLQEELKVLRNASLSTSISNALGMSSNQGSSSGKKNKLILHSSLEIVKEGGCRVMAFNEWLNMLVISMPSQVSMFPGSGVKKINVIDVKAERYVPIHSKQLRDLAFNPAKNDLLLSVGMDKQVKLTNICNNAPVGSFTADFPLWSCCWNADNANQFFVGTATGSVIMYDTRNTSEPVQTIQVSGSGPVVSLCYIPLNAGASFSLGGLLVARLQSCSFVVVKEDGIQDNALPLEGPFISVSFERTTRHMLASCRPSQKYPHARHLVCELQNVNISADAGILKNVVTANVIHTFRGGTTQKVLSRSSLIAHPLKPGNILVCASDESTQSTFIWDVSTGSCLQQLKSNDTIIDILHIKCNENAYLALLTDKSVKFYKWVDIL